MSINPWAFYGSLFLVWGLFLFFYHRTKKPKKPSSKAIQFMYLWKQYEKELDIHEAFVAARNVMNLEHEEPYKLLFEVFQWELYKDGN